MHALLLIVELIITSTVVAMRKQYEFDQNRADLTKLFGSRIEPRNKARAKALLNLSDMCYKIPEIGEIDEADRAIMLRSARLRLHFYLFRDSFRGFIEDMKLIGGPFLNQESFLEEWVKFAQEKAEKLADDLNPRREGNIVISPFLSNIRNITLEGVGDPGNIIRALVNGTGICNMFKHPDEKKSFNGPEENVKLLSKVGYLIRFIYQKFNIIPEELYNYQQLYLVCEVLGINLLPKSKRKSIMHLLLSKAIDIAVNDWIEPPDYKLLRGPYETTNICGNLLVRKNARIDNMKRRFPDETTRVLFLEECLEDLGELWSIEYASSYPWQAYYSAVLNRWFSALKKVVEIEVYEDNRNWAKEYNFILNSIETHELNLKKKSETDSSEEFNIYTVENDFILQAINPRTNLALDRLLRDLIAQLPIKMAIAAYETGGGICKVKDDPKLNEIYQVLVELAKMKRKEELSFEGDFIGLEHGQSPSLFEFVYLKMMCDYMEAEPRSFNNNSEPQEKGF